MRRRINASVAVRHREMAVGEVAAVIVVVLTLAPCSSAQKSHGWEEARGPHFTVYSEAGENKAKEAVARLEQMRTVLEQALPEFRVDTGRPVRVLMFRDAKGRETFTRVDGKKRAGFRRADYVKLGLERAYVARRTDGGQQDSYQQAAVTLA